MIFKKNIKVLYYVKSYFNFFLPNFIFKKRLKKSLIYYNSLDDTSYIDERVLYYNKLDANFSTDETSKYFKEFYKTEKRKTYFLDSIEYLKAFDYNNKINYAFGDVTYIPKLPAFVKSRPILGDNANSVVLKLDKVRHFFFIKDSKDFASKKNIVVWRGEARGKPHRKVFLEALWNHPLCDVGQTHKPPEDVPWQKERMSIKQQLEYKFVFCIEGNDVATNIKWAMSSNSLVFSFKMVYETWYMEGRLKPDVHFVLIKDDLSNLEEKINYYSEHIKEAQTIINNAHDWVKQFSDKKREDAISFLVIQKYFKLQE